MPVIAPMRMPVIVFLLILRVGFVGLRFGSPGSVGSETEELIKADVGVGKGEKDVLLSQACSIATRFLSIVGLLFQRVNCAMSSLTRR